MCNLFIFKLNFILSVNIPAHIGFSGNEEADKASKQAKDMSRMTTTRLPHTDYRLPDYEEG